MILFFERPGRLMELCSRLQQKLYIAPVTVERAQISEYRLGKTVAQTKVCATISLVAQIGLPAYVGGDGGKGNYRTISIIFNF